MGHVSCLSLHRKDGSCQLSVLTQVLSPWKSGACQLSVLTQEGWGMSVVCLNTGYLSFLRIPMDGILINFSVLGTILGEILNVSVFYSNSQFIVTFYFIMSRC